MKSDEVALPVPSNSTAAFAPTLADASQNLAICVGPRMCEYSQDRQPSGGFPELEATTPNSKCPGPQEASNKNASEEPHPSQEKAITSNKDALEELGPSQQKPWPATRMPWKSCTPANRSPWPATRMPCKNHSQEQLWLMRLRSSLQSRGMLKHPRRQKRSLSRKQAFKVIVRSSWARKRAMALKSPQ